MIGTLRDVVRSKNGDELIQKTLWHSKQVDLSHAKQQGVNPTSKADAQADGDEAAKHIRVLASLFLTNGEVRKLVSDLGLIGRELLSNAAVKVADASRPSQEQMGQVDNPAQANTFIGPDGQTLGPNDSPQLAVKGPDGTQIRYDPKHPPSQAQIHDGQGNVTTAGEAYTQYQDTKQQLKDQAAQAATDPQSASQSASQDPNVAQAKQTAQYHASAIDQHRDPNASYTTQARQVRDGAIQHLDQDPQARDAKDQAKGHANRLSNKIPEQHRQRAAEAWSETTSLIDDAFPEERRDQFIYRLKKVLYEVQQHKDYNEAMSWLLDTAEKYNSHAEHVIGKGVDAHQEASRNKHATGTVQSWITIFERFANGRSLEPVQNAADQMYTDANNDPELRQWWKAADDYVHRVLLEPGYVMDEECDQEGEQLKRVASSWFGENGRYKAHWDNLWDQLSNWFKAFHEDELNRQFGDDWKRLTQHLVYDEDGKFTFKPHLWNDIRRVILPAAIRNIGYIPIPRAELIDEKLDLTVEGVTLSGPNLFPNVVNFESVNKFKFSPFDSIPDKSYHRIHIGMSQIQADIKDVRFAFRKKSGFPKISDRGLADVTIARQGITVAVEIETVDRRDSFFRVRSVNTSIDQLSFKIRESKHDLLYKFIKPAAVKIIKQAITQAVESSIRSGLEYLDDELVGVRNRMEEAKSSEDTTRTQALKDMFARKKAVAEEKKADAEEKVAERGTDFHFVIDRKDEKLGDMMKEVPGSVTERLWKTEDAAMSGTDWKSPAFSIVDHRHPATTGEHHPHATPGAAAGKSLTAGTTGNEPNNAAATGAPVAAGGVPVAAASVPGQQARAPAQQTPASPTSRGPPGSTTQHGGATSVSPAAAHTATTHQSAVGAARGAPTSASAQPAGFASPAVGGVASNTTRQNDGFIQPNQQTQAGTLSGQHTHAGTLTGQHTQASTLPGQHTQAGTLPGQHTQPGTLPGQQTEAQKLASDVQQQLPPTHRAL